MCLVAEFWAGMRLGCGGVYWMSLRFCLVVVRLGC